jgi:NADH dehydrogenase (ubiquinone) Fe-S protein 1
MVMLYINNKSYAIPKNFTILQAMEFTGNVIPHFCYHETLFISGNCRMCLVEVEKMPKPAVACSLVVLDKMKIFTNTPLIQKVRESILEFLLINHPLDCPICDQGGECDLQDYSLNYGTDRSRFFENKRSVSDKSFNILIKSIMSRCIHCTRCIRFMSDVVSLNILGTTGRGNAIEIGTYFHSGIKNEFSGNIIDLCPVGALTSKVYSFKARPWELRTIEFIDVFDSMTIPIQLHLKSNNNINKITPFKNFEINNF